MDHGNRPERESGDEDYPPAPLPAHERTWRHPSELGSGQTLSLEPGPAMSKGLAAGAAVLSLVLVVALTRLMLPGDADGDRSVLATSATARSGSPLVATTLVATTVALASSTPSTSATGGASTAVLTTAAPTTLVGGAGTTSPPTTDGAPSTDPSGTTTPAVPVTTSPGDSPTTTAPSTTAGSEPAPPATAPPPAVALLASAEGGGPSFAVEVQRASLYITTSAAVGDARTTPMVLSDGTTVDADVVMLDDAAGIAVLQVPDTDVHGGAAASLHSADGAAPGQTVTVLDSDTSTTVTGVIGSGTSEEGAHELLADMPLVEGAPVLDDEGNLVGICTASGQQAWVVPAAALNAAIAASVDLASADAWLGVNGEHAPGGGVTVVDVVAGSPAQAGGLEPGDVITSLGDSTVLSIPDLALDLADHAPGDEVVLRVQRAGTELDMTVVLAERPA